jgi:RHS repeat-associated protein
LSLISTESVHPTRCGVLTLPRIRWLKNHAENRTSVVRAFLSARYYNSAQGQFLSEDPVFLGDPKSQVLTDPQSLNSYSYASDNPIVKSDPNGKQVCEAACADLVVYPAAAYFAPAILSGIGAAATYITADIALRSNPGQRFIPFGQQGRVVTVPNPPSLFPDGEPPKVPDSKWLKWGLAGTLTVDLATSLYDPLKNLKDSIAGLKNAVPSQDTSKQANNQSMIQFRAVASGYAKSTPSTLPTTVSQNGINYVRDSSGLLNSVPSR